MRGVFDCTDLHRLIRPWCPAIPGTLIARFGPHAKLAKFQMQTVARLENGRWQPVGAPRLRSARFESALSQGTA